MGRLEKVWPAADKLSKIKTISPIKYKIAIDWRSKIITFSPILLAYLADLLKAGTPLGEKSIVYCIDPNTGAHLLLNTCNHNWLVDKILTTSQLGNADLAG